MNAKKMELIKQLLAKAESTTPEEAEALVEAATKLMARHGIDEAMLARNAKGTNAESDVVHETYFFCGIYAKGFAYMANNIVRAFPAQRLLMSDPAWNEEGVKGVRVYVYGFKSEVEQTMVLLQSIHMQAIAAQSTWWRNYKKSGAHALYSRMDQYKMRRQFIISFGDGVAAKIRDAMEAATTEYVNETKTDRASTDLVLRDRASVVHAHVNAFSSRSRSRGIDGGGHAAASAGRHAGRNANIGQKGIAR